MGDLSLWRVYAVPVALTSLMALFAAVACSIAGVQGVQLLRPYAGAGTAITLISVLIWAFITIVEMAGVRAEQPIGSLFNKFQLRWRLLALPAIVLPIFLSAYTASKSSIYFLVGFEWDQFWADLDYALFGVDPWRLTHALLGPSISPALAWVYSVGWGLTLFFTSAFVTLNGDHRKVAVYFSAMIAAWLMGGVVMAYGTSAAGPVFAHLFDPSLADRFQPLRASLNDLLPAENSIRTTQSYLAASVGTTNAVKGGGISAMPSMHLAACTIYVMAAIGTRWIVPAMLFWAVIFIGSVHFGYHYAVDGPAAAIIAITCWMLAEAYYRKGLAQAQSSPLQSTTTGQAAPSER